MVGDEVYEAASGSYILKPRGVPHTFWNAGAEPAKLLEIISPAGFEKYSDEVAEVISDADDGPPDFARISEIAGGYGLTFHMERMEEIMARRNVELR